MGQLLHLVLRSKQFLPLEDVGPLLPGLFFFSFLKSQESRWSFLIFRSWQGILVFEKYFIKVKQNTLWASLWTFSLKRISWLFITNSNAPSSLVWHTKCPWTDHSILSSHSFQVCGVPAILLHCPSGTRAHASRSVCLYKCSFLPFHPKSFTFYQESGQMSQPWWSLCLYQADILTFSPMKLATTCYMTLHVPNWRIVMCF